MTSMRARQYAPIAPLDVEPVGPYTEPEQREEALRDALRDVQLGAHDERIMTWALRAFDNSTLRVFVSWMERTRAAGIQEARHPQPRRHADRGVAPIPQAYGRHYS